MIQIVIRLLIFKLKSPSLYKEQFISFNYQLLYTNNNWQATLLDNKCLLFASLLVLYSIEVTLFFVNSKGQNI